MVLYSLCCTVAVMIHQVTHGIKQLLYHFHSVCWTIWHQNVSNLALTLVCWLSQLVDHHCRSYKMNLSIKYPFLVNKFHTQHEVHAIHLASDTNRKFIPCLLFHSSSWINFTATRSYCASTPKLIQCCQECYYAEVRRTKGALHTRTALQNSREWWKRTIPTSNTLELTPAQYWLAARLNLGIDLFPHPILLRACPLVV